MLITTANVVAEILEYVPVLARKNDNHDRLWAQPKLDRERLVEVFKCLVPTRGEEDLERIFEAFSKDAPGMPLLKLFKKIKKKGLMFKPALG